MAQSISDFLDSIGKPSNVVPLKKDKPAPCAREPYVPEPAFYRLPAKSMSWKYDAGVGGKHSHDGATIVFNKKDRGRIEWREQSQSYDAWIRIRMRRNNGMVDCIEASVTGLETKDSAGREVVKQWFRRAAKMGWIS